MLNTAELIRETLEVQTRLGAFREVEVATGQGLEGVTGQGCAVATGCRLARGVATGCDRGEIGNLGENRGLGESGDVNESEGLNKMEAKNENEDLDEIESKNENKNLNEIEGKNENEDLNEIEDEDENKGEGLGLVPEHGSELVEACCMLASELSSLTHVASTAAEDRGVLRAEMGVEVKFLSWATMVQGVQTWHSERQ